MIPFFRRGTGPLISVLVCSRGRQYDLLQAVDSCVSLAADPGRLEFVIKADSDDADTIATVGRLKGQFRPGQVKLLVGDRGNGYHDIHLWTDWMCREATGDWLFVFNDDARIQVERWDDVVHYSAALSPWPGIQDVCMMVAYTIGRPLANEFFFLRRRTYEILGYVGDSPHADNWLYTVLNYLGCAFKLGVVVDHLSDRKDDDTRRESVEAYKDTIYSLNNVGAKWRRMEDAAKLLSRLSAEEAGRVWAGSPKTPGWHFWRAGPARVERSVYVDPGGAMAYISDSGELRVWGETGGEWCPL